MRHLPRPGRIDGHRPPLRRIGHQDPHLLPVLGLWMSSDRDSSKIDNALPGPGRSEPLEHGRRGYDRGEIPVLGCSWPRSGAEAVARTSDRAAGVPPPPLSGGPGGHGADRHHLQAHEALLARAQINRFGVRRPDRMRGLVGTVMLGCVTGQDRRRLCLQARRHP